MIINPFLDIFSTIFQFEVFCPTFSDHVCAPDNNGLRPLTACHTLVILECPGIEILEDNTLSGRHVRNCLKCLKEVFIHMPYHEQNEPYK